MSRDAHVCSQDLTSKKVLFELGAIHSARDRSNYPAGSGWNLLGSRHASSECLHSIKLLFSKSRGFCQFQCVNAGRPLAVSGAQGRMNILIHSSLACSRPLPITLQSLLQAAFTINHQPSINPLSLNNARRVASWPDHVV
jgi:hypothetical protein